eukprot:1153165-Pelagomonas_calceolata.AAC.2
MPSSDHQAMHGAFVVAGYMAWCLCDGACVITGYMAWCLCDGACVAAGYIESVKQLRETLLIQEWDMSNRHLAKKRWVPAHDHPPSCHLCCIQALLFASLIVRYSNFLVSTHLRLSAQQRKGYLAAKGESFPMLSICSISGLRVTHAVPTNSRMAMFQPRSCVYLLAISMFERYLVEFNLYEEDFPQGCFKGTAILAFTTKTKCAQEALTQSLNEFYYYFTTQARTMDAVYADEAGGFEVIGALYEDPDAYVELLVSERLRGLARSMMEVCGYCLVCHVYKNRIRMAFATEKLVENLARSMIERVLDPSTDAPKAAGVHAFKVALDAPKAALI